MIAISDSNAFTSICKINCIVNVIVTFLNCLLLIKHNSMPVKIRKTSASEKLNGY